MSNAELIAEARRWPSDMGEGATLNAFANALEAVERDLAAAQAVIARAGAANAAPHANTRQSNSRMTAVDSALAGSPVDVLQAVKAAAWDEGYLARARYESAPDFMRESNPYRKDKTDE